MENALFIDGTKVEADANKYFFTWLKSVEKYEARFNDNIKLMYEQFMEQQINIISYTVKDKPNATNEILQEEKIGATTKR